MGSSVRTLLFSDIEGSTALLERAGADYPVLLDAHRSIVREEVAAAGGTEHGTEGDSFFVSFSSPTGAAAAAVGVQRRIEAWPWPAGQRVRVRIGMHAGEVIEHDGGLVGLPVHHAARLAASAHGGQIVASDRCAGSSAACPSTRPGATSARLVRDVGRIGIHQLDHPDLQTDFPPLRGIHAAPNNLPRPPASAFIEPPALLATLGAAVEGAPIVTLTGTGGIGKTRLALEAARRVAARHPDGTWFVDLAPVTDPDALPSALVSALPMVLAGDSMTEAAVAWIGEQQLLLVVDNCEHLVAAVADLVETIVARCPNTTVLATSREPLGLDGERVLRVESLDPDSTAVQLFVDRARAVDADSDSPATKTWSGRSVPASTGSPSPSSSPRARCARCRRPSCSSGCTIGSASCAAAAAVSTVTRRCAPPSRGRRARCRPPSSASWTGCRCSPTGGCGVGRARLRLRRAGRTDVAEHLHALVDKSLVTRQRGRWAPATACSRPSASSPRSGWAGAPRLETRDRHVVDVAALAERLDRASHGDDEVLARQRFAAEWENIRSAHAWALESDDLDAAQRINDASFTTPTCRCATTTN